MSNSTEYYGTIKEKAGNKAFIVIERNAACALCRARSSCLASAKAEELVEAVVLPGDAFEVGEKVELNCAKAISRRAVVLVLLIPLVLIVVTVGISVLAFDCGDRMGAVVGLALVGLWYLALYLFRNMLNDGVVFTVRKINIKTV
ncbi:MAG: SoxR reducing system RseC family protein [Tannerellaceae bacterium]|nr:SoxR reducing system RseC family protein [Tannerellaceae bacterium]